MKLFAYLLILLLTGCSRARKEFVVLYTSQDQFYAEPILREFTASTGIEVRPLFDTESAKTAGLVHRLRAESRQPQCDLFWSNEEMHTRMLVREGYVHTNDWQTAGSRTRRLVFNTNLVADSALPKSLLELTNRAWAGRIALAYPLFGTTKSHFFALRQIWGDEVWKSWCAGLVRNGAKIVDGNSVVVKLVGTGECALGLTDSDDIAAGLRQGFPIRAAALGDEFIVIPSTIAIIKGAPHPATARALADYLARPETLQRLVALGALESVEQQPASPGLFSVDWTSALDDAESITRFLEQIFIRS